MPKTMPSTATARHWLKAKVRLQLLQLNYNLWPRACNGYLQDFRGFGRTIHVSEVPTIFRETIG